MEQYLQHIVNYQQNHMVQWLPLAELAANNYTTETTNYFVFFRNYGFHLGMIFGQHPIKYTNHIHQVNAQQMAQQMEQLFSKLRAKMKRAQAVHSEQVNKSQRVSTPLEVSDKVWQDARNIWITTKATFSTGNTSDHMKFQQSLVPGPIEPKYPTSFAFTMSN
jgi:hypothetical protein